MVVDCQGVYDSSTNTFTLTDPAIHTKKSYSCGFGGTNLMNVGFDKFFATHVCNGCCHRLSLPPVASVER